MGCRITKTLLAPGGDVVDSRPSVSQPPLSSSVSVAASATLPVSGAMPNTKQLKARLERLMCVARETPEPVFELSGCDLRTVPAGVFILCKVLRKERLDLSGNRLRSLVDGGALVDLLLLTHLDLSSNAFKTLPDELTQLVNLQELHVQNNRITHLPANLNQLHRLEFLDCSHNQLQDIRPIACMVSLRVLNLTGNPLLARLPMELSTCAALVDLVLDVETVREPAGEILERGTQAVLAFLAGNVDGWRDVRPPPSVRLQVEMGTEVTEEPDGIGAENGSITEDAEFMDAIAKQLQIDQQRSREVLLQQLIRQQYDNDALVSELQMKRDAERNKLIEDITNAEATSTLAVDRLLSLRSAVTNRTDDELAERQQFALLDQLRAQHSELQRTKVLNEMSEQLGREHEQIAAYEVRRDREHGQLMRHIEADSERLGRAVGQTDEERSVAVERIVSDDRLQRAAVAALIDRGDGQSWALMQQVRLIEAELVRMTGEELRRRQCSADDHMNQLCAQRMDLTSLLAELMDQQERRKQQLLDGLLRMESEQLERDTDFWLLQYQKLLDVRSADDDPYYSALDPRLGYQLLAHGVIHLLPFLSRLLRPAKGAELRDICDDQLRAAGVREAADRRAILRAIEAFDAENADCLRVPSAPAGCEEVAERRPDNSTVVTEEKPVAVKRTSSTTIEGLAECVVCMERASKIIFLPCGHLCCCAECQEPLTMCPMCRAAIERRIKVIQA